MDEEFEAINGKLIINSNFIEIIIANDKFKFVSKSQNFLKNFNPGFFNERSGYAPANNNIVISVVRFITGGEVKTLEEIKYDPSQVLNQYTSGRFNLYLKSIDVIKDNWLYGTGIELGRKFTACIWISAKNGLPGRTHQLSIC